MSNNQNNYMYYFDGRNVLMDTNPKFDQVYDYSLNKNEEKLDRYDSINKSQASGFQYGGISNNNSQGFNQTNYTNKLVIPNSPEEVYNIIKEQHKKTKGFPEYRSQILFNFFLEYRTFKKRHLKVPTAIEPLLFYDNKTIKDMLDTIYNKYLEKQHKEKNKRDLYLKKLSSHNKPKFTKDTMKRLYPKLKENEIENVQDYRSIDKVFERVVYHYYIKNGDYKDSNDEKTIISFWQNIPDDEKNAYFLNWDAGENSFVAEVSKFLSDDEILNRIARLFKKVCGYDASHERPLHDYWEKQITYENKHLKGLAKYHPDVLYSMLQKRNATICEEKKYNKDLIQQEEINKNKQKEEEYKRSKEEYKKILDKFKKLSKPKDKWRTGNAMIKLRKRFNYDNIIQKMIKIEFSTNRRFKLSDEYEIYDSDEERKTVFKSDVEKKIP